ncbi:Sec66 [Kluyveromyces lactis]|nr:Sec66 [Kluyveromyces lactis]
MSDNGTHFNETFFEGQEKPEIKVVSVYTPLIYVSILVISLMIFASKYRRSQVKKLAELPSIFDEHEARDLYFAIAELAETEQLHPKVVKAALLNRGAEAVRRTIKLREVAVQIEILYKNGSVDDKYWQRYQNEMKLVDLELKSCIEEAERLQPDWPQAFVNLCREICFNQALQRRYDSILDRKNIFQKLYQLKLDDNGKLIQ